MARSSFGSDGVINAYGETLSVRRKCDPERPLPARGLLFGDQRDVPVIKTNKSVHACAGQPSFRIGGTRPHFIQLSNAGLAVNFNWENAILCNGIGMGCCDSLFFANYAQSHLSVHPFSGYSVGQPTPSFRAELALDPESRRRAKLLDENRPKLKPSPIAGLVLVSSTRFRIALE